MLEEVRKEFSFHKGYTEGRAESHFNALVAAIQQMGTSIHAEIRHEVGAVRADLAEFKTETRAEFARVHGQTGELKTGLAEVKAELAEFKTETRAEFTQLRGEISSIKDRVGPLGTEFTAFKAETKAEFAELRGEISGIKMLAEHQTAQNAAAMQSISLLNHKMDQGFREFKGENADIKTAMKTMAKTLKTFANNHSKT